MWKYLSTIRWVHAAHTNERQGNFKQGSQKFLGYFECHFALTLTSDYLVGDYRETGADEPAHKLTKKN